MVNKIKFDENFVFCKKSFSHPTRKNEKVFIEGCFYEFKLTQIKNPFSWLKVKDDNFYYYVFKKGQHQDKKLINPGFNYQIGFYFLYDDFKAHFEIYDKVKNYIMKREVIDFKKRNKRRKIYIKREKQKLNKYQLTYFNF